MPITKPLKDPREAIGRGLSHPFALLKKWQKDAKNHERIDSADVVVLATACPRTHRPSQRPMQIVDITDNNFLFLSTTSSKKGHQISENRKVSLYFDWLPLNRYVSIEGECSILKDKHLINNYFQKTFNPDIKRYFSAVDDNQSKVIDDDFKEKFQGMRHKMAEFKDSKIPVPECMVLFKVQAKYFEFYENSKDYGCVRLTYQRFSSEISIDNHYTFCENPDWIIEQIAP